MPMKRKTLTSIYEDGESSASASRRNRSTNDESNNGENTTVPTHPSCMDLLMQQHQGADPLMESSVEERLSDLYAQRERELESFWQRQCREEYKRRREIEAMFMEQLNLWKIQAEAVSEEAANKRRQVEAKLREKERELERMKEREALLGEKDRKLQYFKQVSHYFETRSSNLEASLRVIWQEAADGAGCSTSGAAEAAAAAQEEAQSAFVDPNRVPPVDITCENCRRRPSTIMIYPCSHLCLCSDCQFRTEFCPICNMSKGYGFRVKFP